MGMSDGEEAELMDIDQDENMDVRTTRRQKDKMVAYEDGYVSDSEGEEDELSPRPSKRRRTLR